jgi:hypothetical protein
VLSSEPAVARARHAAQGDAPTKTLAGLQQSLQLVSSIERVLLALESFPKTGNVDNSSSTVTHRERSGRHVVHGRHDILCHGPPDHSPQFGAGMVSIAKVLPSGNGHNNNAIAHRPILARVKS